MLRMINEAIDSSEVFIRAVERECLPKALLEAIREDLKTHEGVNELDYMKICFEKGEIHMRGEFASQIKSCPPRGLWLQCADGVHSWWSPASHAPRR